MPDNNFPVLQRKLLRWYDHHKRDLPWRGTGDPYAIWVSETMLQQTQVATVVPYFEKFLRALPDVRALERAPIDKVLQLWSGLGYYRRAKNLKRAARKIIREHGGRLPRQYTELRQLPGIGDYTAGAILSIAFQQRYPAVDGNVRRVLGRLRAVSDQARLRVMAAALVPRSRPGDFNQALMELGSLVCIPKDPLCDRCPLAAHCVAAANAGQPERGCSRREMKFTQVIWPLAIIRRRGKILLRRRPDNGLLARLWELPGGVCKPGVEPIEFLGQELKPIGVKPKRLKPLGMVRHSITYRRIRAPRYCIDCDADAKISLPSRDWRWFDADAIRHVATSSMTAKALQTLPS